MTLRLILASLSGLALVACGGAQKPAASTTSCDAVGDHVAANLRQDGLDHGVDLRELPAVARAVVAERCTTDGWSVAARACLVTADDQGMTKCTDDLLTDEQERALEHAMEDRVKSSPDFQRMLDAMHGPERTEEPAGGSAAPPPPPSDPCGADE